MASPTLFESQPPFPDGIPVADIPKISLRRLVTGDDAEAMLSACCKLGFFLLDLTGDTLGEKMIKDVDAVFEIARQTMELSTAEKEKYAMDIPRDYLGYVILSFSLLTSTRSPFLPPSIPNPPSKKALNAVLLQCRYKARGLAKTDSGAPDRCEFFNISRDHILGTVEPARSTPEPIRGRREVLESYVRHGHSIQSQILIVLAAQLGLSRSTFQDFHSLTEPSGTIVRLIRSYPSAAPEDMRTTFVSHTDVGSITLLANVLGGLQVLAPGREPGDEAGWRWVRPEPGCLIVNMGDAMVEWTGGVLRSNLHRVNHAPGQQRFRDRYSVVLLSRPYYEARMQRMAGGRIPDAPTEGEGDASRSGEDGAKDMAQITMREWELQKMAALKAGKDCAKSRGGVQMKPLAV